MARGGWSRQPRDRRGRWTSYGSGAAMQTGGRGARLMSPGKQRDGGGAKMQAAKPSGTFSKTKKTAGLSNQQKRDMKSRQIELQRSAARNSARANNVGNSPLQQASFIKQAQADRAAAAGLDAKLRKETAPPSIMARGRGITGESLQHYKGKGRESLYGKDLSRTKAARPAGTVKKPRGLKPNPTKPKPAAKPAKTKMSDAEKTIRAAQKRLKTKQYGYTASQSQALAIDRRLAKQTPQGLAASRVKGARADVMRTRRNLRSGINDNAPAAWRQHMEKSLTTNKANFKKAAADYRLLNPKKRK